MGELIVEILKIVLPALLVLTGVILMLNFFLKRERQKDLVELRSMSVARLVPLRLQAYERLVLFMERISPENLILRCDASGKDGKLFLTQLQIEVRSEFEHNLSQQLFVSDECWAEVIRAKEQVLTLINESASELPANASGLELGKRILGKMMAGEAMPTRRAIGKLKFEFQKALPTA